MTFNDFWSGSKNCQAASFLPFVVSPANTVINSCVVMYLPFIKLFLMVYKFCVCN
jgi:hypothetical protein